jgi:hypothetical protein
MIIITEKHLGKAIDFINELDVKSYSTFMNDFAKKQPNLVSYMVANAESLSNAAARDELVYLLSIIWICYKSLNLPI